MTDQKKIEEVKKILDELRYENHHTNQTLAILIDQLYHPEPTPLEIPNIEELASLELSEDSEPTPEPGGKAPSRLLTRKEIIESGRKGNFDLLALQDTKTHSIDLDHEQAEKRRIKEEIEVEIGHLVISPSVLDFERWWQSFWEKELR